MNSKVKNLTSLLAIGSLATILVGTKVEDIDVGNYSNPTTYHYTGESNEAEVFTFNPETKVVKKEIMEVPSFVPGKPTSYWNDTQKQVSLYGKPLFNFGDIERTAYGMSFNQDVVKGILAKDSSIVDDNGVIWKQVSRGHDFIGYEPWKQIVNMKESI